MKDHLSYRSLLKIVIVYLFITLAIGTAGCSSEEPGTLKQLRPPSDNQLKEKSTQPLFTPEEKAWLMEHPIIRMGVEKNFPPYEFLDNNGSFTGISEDYRELIEKKLGIEFQIQEFPDYSSVYDAIKRKEIDLVLLLTPTADRKQFLNFTQPFFDYQLVMITRDDHPAVDSLEDFNGKTVAVVKDYASAEYIAKKYPMLNVVAYPTVEDGLMAVSTGKADAFVNEVFAAVHHIRDKSINNVKVAASLETDLPGYAIGVRDDWPELVPILDKVLTSLTLEEKLQISEKWLAVKYEQGFNYSLFWRVLAGGLLILGIFVYWNRRLAKEVTLRKQTEFALRESETRYRLLFERSASAIAVHEKIPAGDDYSSGYRFQDVNPVFEQLTGLRREQVIGQEALAVLPGYDKYWMNLYEEVAAGGEGASFEQYFAPLDKYYQGIAYSPQPGQFAVSFMDITQRKRVEDQLRNYQQHLEELVQERTADLEAKNTILAAEIIERQRAQQELKESEANFRAIAESASDAILIAAGSEGHFMFANRRAEELSGYSADELREIGIYGLVKAEERRRIFEMDKLRLGGEPIPDQFETAYIRKNGMEIPVEVAIAQIHWHGEAASMAIVRDISERKKREAEIIQQNYELEVIANFSSAIRAIDKPAELAALILEKSLNLLAMDCGFLALSERDNLTFVAGQCLPGSIECIPDSVRNYFLHNIEAGSPIFISNRGEKISLPIEAGPIWNLLNEYNSWVVIPLKSFDSTVAILATFSHDSRIISPSVNRMITAIADMAGSAIERLLTLTTLEERVADRTRDLAALYQVMTVVNQTGSMEQILDKTLNLALQAVNCSAGCISLLEAETSMLEAETPVFLPPTKSPNSYGDLLTLWDNIADTALSQEVTATNKPMLVADLSNDPRIPSIVKSHLTGELIGVPLNVGRTVLGILWGFSSQSGHLSLEDVALLVSIGERIGTTIENFRLRERTQQVAILEERQRLARDLHDSVTQQIYSLLLMAGGAKKSLTINDTENSIQLIKRIEEIGRQALKELRLLIFELRPLDLQQVGLVEALHQRLESVEQRAGIQARLVTQVDTKIPVDIEEEFYRIAIEALNNSLKHSAASEVTVRFCSTRDKVELEIMDNGRGFNVGKKKSWGSGLISMQERAKKIDAVLTIQSNPGTGTSIMAVREAKL